MLEVTDLHSFYGEAQVLNGVSISVRAGELVALLGRNGMGKTSLIRSIMGLAQPRVRSGSVRFLGEELRGEPPHRIARRKIGYVPQGRRLFASLTVQEHLALVPGPHGAWTAQRIFEVFPRLAGRRSHRATQLSGGERQMLAIARSLMSRPRLLLLDEPSLGLAPRVTAEIVASLAHLRDETGLTLLLVEQNASTALSVADRAVVLNLGRKVEDDRADNLAADDRVRHAYLGM
jgi:branched-chain amino acid transport system ATP-binding protein